MGSDDRKERPSRKCLWHVPRYVVKGIQGHSGSGPCISPWDGGIDTGSLGSLV